jgi:hypothetical protein
MGLMERLLDFVFGAGGAVKETVEVFRENAEARAERDHKRTQDALEQFAHEYQHSGPALFDRVIDGVNRLPRPALAFGTLGLFVAAMVDPLWFAERMGGMALVPEPLWWLLGAIVSFYFGARHQVKSQQFQTALSETYLRAEAFRTRVAARSEARSSAKYTGQENAALDAWRNSR